jgi:hypothetical protein
MLIFSVVYQHHFYTNFKIPVGYLTMIFQYRNYTALNDINWKEFRRKWMWSNQGTLPKFAWRYWGKP